MADASATKGDHQEKAGRRFRTPMFEKLLQPRRKKEQPAEPTPDEVIVKQVSLDIRCITSQEAGGGALFCAFC
jgi:hypothetical protein